MEIESQKDQIVVPRDETVKKDVQSSEEHLIPSAYITSRLKELIMDQTASVGTNYRKELKKLLVCFAQYLLTLSHQIMLEKGEKEITRRHVELALEEANFEQFKERIVEFLPKKGPKQQKLRSALRQR